jgi:transposase
MKQKKEITMPVINYHVAGIDIGSKSHFVAIGQNKEDVKEFGINTVEHKKLVDYLKSNGIEKIAMESTGNYWQTLFAKLQESNFEVILVPGSQTKNGIKKTDVLDCQWIQRLHSLGLLSGCYLPDEETMRIRNLARHRSSLVEQAARYSNKIQMTLRLMNIRLDVSIRDVVGKTGMAIIEAILAGERKAEKLVELVDCRVKKSKEEIVLNLNGQWNDELLYELDDCVSLLKLYNSKIAKIDIMLQQILEEINIGKVIPNDIILTKKQEKGKHACAASLSQHGYLMYETDLMAIPGVGPGIMLSIISELGRSIYKFHTAKEFCAWLRLAPNNKISGGKIISSKTPLSKNSLSKAFKDAANAIGLSKSDDSLCAFFKKIAFKNGRGAAIKATARKLATIVYKMIFTKMPYSPQSIKVFTQKQQNNKIKQIKKTLEKYNISITDLQSLTLS